MQDSTKGKVPLSNDSNSGENVDYYFTSTGLMVFTEHYLLKRGYCCRNGCRHCPYGFKKQGKSTK